MTDWFRSWHGAPTDPKWLGIAKRAGVAPGIAVAVAWALMDRASQAEDRGRVSGYDAEGLACFFGCEAEQVDSLVSAMTDKGMIVDGRFASWERRQPKREDNSSERVKAHRERIETQRNAASHDVTLEEKREETEKKETPTDVGVRRASAPASASKTGRASRLAPDWRPSPESWANLKAKHNAGDAQLERELDKARNWSASAKNGAKLNHEAFFANWCTTAEEDGRFGRAPPGGLSCLDVDPVTGNILDDQQPPRHHRPNPGDRPFGSGSHSRQTAALADVFGFGARR